MTLAAVASPIFSLADLYCNFGNISAIFFNVHFEWDKATLGLFRAGEAGNFERSLYTPQWRDPHYRRGILEKGKKTV